MSFVRFGVYLVLLGLAFAVSFAIADSLQKNSPIEATALSHFGDVPVNSKATATVKLRNASRNPVTLRVLLAPCGWTISNLPNRLGSHESTVLDIQVDPAFIVEGKLDGMLQLGVDGTKHRSIEIEIRGTAFNLATLNKTSIDLLPTTPTKTEPFSISGHHRKKGIEIVRLESPDEIKLNIGSQNGTFQIDGVLRAKGLPGRYQKTISIYFSDYPDVPMQIPINFNIESVFEVSNCPTKAMISGEKRVISIVGPPESHLTLISVPKWIMADLRTSGEGRFDLTITPQPLKHLNYHKGSVVIETNVPTQPRIGIPVYAVNL